MKSASKFPSFGPGLVWMIIRVDRTSPSVTSSQLEESPSDIGLPEAFCDSPVCAAAVSGETFLFLVVFGSLPVRINIFIAPSCFEYERMSFSIRLHLTSVLFSRTSRQAMIAT